MADLDQEGKPQKVTNTERKPLPPQTTPSPIQVHRGNVDILSLKFLESISASLARIEKALEKLNG